MRPTNRERHLVRSLMRNAYELSEREVDDIIIRACDGSDVTRLHREQLHRERGDCEDLDCHYGCNS